MGKKKKKAIFFSRHRPSYTAYQDSLDNYHSHLTVSHLSEYHYAVYLQVPGLQACDLEWSKAGDLKLESEDRN